MAENQPPERRKSVAKPLAKASPAAGAAAAAAAAAAATPAADPRRVSVIVPPDRHQQMMSENTRRKSTVQNPNAPLAINQDRRKVSVVQQPSASQLAIPEKFPRKSVVRAPLPSAFQDASYTESASRGKRPSGMDALAVLRTQADAMEASGGYGTNHRKLTKAEVDEYYSRIKTINKFKRFPTYSSMTSYMSTISSVSSSFSVSSEAAMSISGSDRGGPEWSQRWVINKSGKQQGQIKCVKDVCFLRSTENVAVTEYKNARVQIFSQSGKSVALLGPDSDNDRTATSFTNPLNFRKIEPTGICETAIGNLLAVTDHSRLLYIDASATGLLEAEIMVGNRHCLNGIAAMLNSRLILTETGTQASVGLFETSGRLIREYKGNFKEPSYVSWNEDIQVAAVSDSGQRAVYLYDANGHLLNTISKQLDEVGPFAYPSGVAWMSEGRLLVADRGERRVVLFDMRNQQALNLLTEHDGLGNPVAIATNGTNRIVVTEEFYDFGVDKYQLKMFKHKSSTYKNNEF